MIDGEDVVKMNAQQLTELRRHKMSMVFQHFGLLPHRRVIDNVAYGLEIRGVDQKKRLEKAGEVVELVGLSGWETNYPRELSGGMQQRVGLARALAVDPEILLFDEPFSALDPLIRRDMQDELLKLQAMVHKTMIFITHDFMEAIKMGDHIAIMKDGVFSQVGTSEELVAEPADDYVREFTEEVPRHKVLSVGKVMHEPACCVSQGDTLAQAREKMAQGKQPAAFVVDHNGKLVGVLHHDALERAGTSGDLASLAENDVRCANPGDKLETLIPITAKSDVPVPVVDEANNLVGAVDRTTVMLALDTRD